MKAINKLLKTPLPVDHKEQVLNKLNELTTKQFFKYSGDDDDVINATSTCANNDYTYLFAAVTIVTDGACYFRFGRDGVTFVKSREKSWSEVARAICQLSRNTTLTLE